MYRLSLLLLSVLFLSNSLILDLNSENLDALMKHSSKPWFILVCTEQGGLCSAYEDTWRQITHKFSETHHIAQLDGEQEKEVTRRFKVSSYPTFLYSEDKKNFIHHLLPRDYDGLVKFIEETHKRVPLERYRSLDPPSLQIYLYESTIELLYDAIDCVAHQAGVSQVEEVSKEIIVVILVVLTVVGFVLLVYSCVIAEIKSKEAQEKKVK